MGWRNDQCRKVCRIIDIFLANRPTERDSLIVAVRKAFEALERQRWIPVTEIPPYGKDLMLKLHDRRRGCDCFYYFAMGFYDGREYHTYLFKYQDDHDLEVVGWQLCPWKGEQE